MTSDGGFGGSAAASLIEGKTFDVTFWVDEDHTASVTVKCLVSDGSKPVISVPKLRNVKLNSVFDENAYMQGVTYSDNEDKTSALVVTHTSPVDTSKDGAVYTVDYTVTDTDHNQTTASGVVTVGWVHDGSCAVKAYSFVTTSGSIKAATNTDSLILQLSHAEAIYVHDDGTVEPISPIVKSNGNFNAAAGTYNIQIGAAVPAGLTDNPIQPITAKVINKDKISNTPDDKGKIHDTNTDDPSDTSHYVVAANNVNLTWAQAGQLVGKTDSATKTKLINYASAEAYKIVTDPKTLAQSTNTMSVDVTANNIKQANGSYDVTFIPQGIGGVAVTVRFNVDQGTMPVITVNGPLKVDQTATSATLSRTQLLAGVSVVDAEGGVTIDDVKIIDPATGAFPVIDTNKVGMYQVQYSVADPIMVDPATGQHKVTTATRAVIVNDGRFIDYPKSKVVIAAKDFVVSTKDSTWSATADGAIKLSWAEAYDYAGNKLAVQLSSALPTGFANRQVGDYQFTFNIAAHPEAIKTITGHVVDADKVDPGNDPYRAPYALTVSNFAMDVSGAAKITNDAGLISAANAKVIKLVPNAANASPVVLNKGGFTASKGTYNITFGVSGRPASEYSETITATLTAGSEPPVINVYPPSVTVNQPPVNVYVGGGGASPTYVSVIGADATTPATGNTAEGSTQPIVNVYNTPAGPATTTPTAWSLFDLLAVILTGLLLVLCVVKFIFDRRKNEEYTDEPINPDQWAAMTPDQRAALVSRRESERRSFEADQDKKNNKVKHYYVNLLALLVVAALFVESLVTLFLTQDFSLPMTFWDKYSWIFALVFLVALIVPAIAAVMRKTRSTPTDRTRTLGTTA
jgi:hypothetical protein